MRNKQIMNHGTLCDTINYKALIDAQANEFCFIDNKVSNNVKLNAKSKAKKLTKCYTRGKLNK